MEDVEQHIELKDEDEDPLLVVKEKLKAQKSSRFRFDSSHSSSYVAHTSSVYDLMKQGEQEKAVRRLEQQLLNEEEISESDDLKKLREDFILHREDLDKRLQYAVHLVRSKDVGHKQEAHRILSDLYRMHERDLDKVTFRAVVYYLAVVNFKLRFYSEAFRFVGIILKEEPENRQARNFLTLLRVKARKKVLVVIDDSYESGLAFDRALGLVDPDLDEMLLVTIFSESQIDPLVKSLRDQPSYYAHRQSKAEELAEQYQLKYKRICADRGIAFNVVYELGEPREDVCTIIKQEMVTTVVVGVGAQEKKGFLNRLRESNMSEYLHNHAHCEVVVVKESVCTA